MTFSPRAIEAAARALCVQSGDDPDKLTYAHAMQCTGHDREPKFTWQYWIPFAEAALTAALAVDGVALVPKEPTEAMIHAGHHQIDWCRNDQATHLPEHPSQTDNGVGTTCKQDICDAWSAMIAASDREERLTPPAGTGG